MGFPAVGRSLTAEMLRVGREAGLHTVIALIESGNEPSIHISREFGFECVGVMREVGRKFGRLLDLTIMQLIFR